MAPATNFDQRERTPSSSPVALFAPADCRLPAAGANRVKCRSADGPRSPRGCCIQRKTRSTGSIPTRGTSPTRIVDRSGGFDGRPSAVTCPGRNASGATASFADGGRSVHPRGMYPPILRCMRAFFFATARSPVACRNGLRAVLLQWWARPVPTCGRSARAAARGRYSLHPVNFGCYSPYAAHRAFVKRPSAAPPLPAAGLRSLRADETRLCRPLKPGRRSRTASDRPRARLRPRVPISPSSLSVRAGPRAAR